MSETFTASNGWYIDKAGNVCAPRGFRVITVAGSKHVAKFFQELRDHELGRWRDPVNPDYVVYPVGDDVVDVLRESSVSPVTPGPGRQASVTREDAEGWDRDHSQSFYAAARRYFQAHPQHKPLPIVGGFYVNRSHARALGDSQIISNRGGVWRFVTSSNPDAEAIAQRWHDAGELVRLVPEGGDDE